MAEKLALKGRQIASKMLKIQLMTVVLVSLLLLIFDKTAALSTLVGGFVSILPNFLFAFFAFKVAGANQTKQVVSGFYKGEAFKFLTTLLLFVWVFKGLSIYPGMVILGYTVAIISNWIAIGIVKTTHFY